MTVFIITKSVEYDNAKSPEPPVVVWNMEEGEKYLRQTLVGTRDEYDGDLITNIHIQQVDGIGPGFWAVHIITEDTVPVEKWGELGITWEDAEYLIHETELWTS